MKISYILKLSIYEFFLNNKENYIKTFSVIPTEKFNQVMRYYGNKLFFEIINNVNYFRARIFCVCKQHVCKNTLNITLV